jgi:hypothetical protein
MSEITESQENKIRQIRETLEEHTKGFPAAVWGWEEKSIEFLLSEHERLTIELESANTRIESVNQALRDGVPAGMKTADEFLDWLYSTLPFLVEDGDKE